MILSSRRGIQKPKATRRLILDCINLEERCVPATLFVDDDGKQKPGAYTTISAALNAAHANDTIKVFQGTYTDAVVINKNGVKLMAQGSNVNWKAPATMTPVVLSGQPIGAAMIDIYSTNVVVDGFNISGSTNADGNLFAGIRVINNGSATITDNSVSGINQPTDPQFGIGIQIGTHRVAAQSGGAGAATVDNNSISDYYAAGIIVDGDGSSADIEKNTITGRGLGGNGGASQYGIQISQGASATIEKNTVTGNAVGGDPLFANSAGIYFFQVSGDQNVADKNSVSGNDIGIFIEDSTGSACNPTEITKNTVTANTGFAGILIQGSDGFDVENNTVGNNQTLNGIALINSENNQVENNDVESNASDGIYAFGGSSNTVDDNDSNNNGGNGIFLEQSANNDVNENTTNGNASNGILVLGGSQNGLVKNSAKKNTLDGVLLQGTAGARVIKNRLQSNNGFGLELQNADNTLICQNTMTGNISGPIWISADSTGTVFC
jgi:parallel beta-helix repeat protein